MKFLNGIRIGEYALDPDKVLDEIREKCVEGRKNYTAIAVYRDEEIEPEKFISWAKYMAENDIYFQFACSRNMKFRIPFNAETVAEMRKVAGEHFLGVFVPELGNIYGCSGYGYTKKNYHHNFEKMSEGVNGFLDLLHERMDRLRFTPDFEVGVVEQTNLISYIPENGPGMLMLETMCGDVEELTPLVRGTTKAKGNKGYINYVAHEWYAGVHNEDELKKKRLRMAYDYSYMNGSAGVILESGDICMSSHGMREGYDHELPQFYRRTLDEFTDFIQNDKRPEGYPITKVAFVQGNFDGYSHFRAGSAVFNNVNDKDWGFGAPEFTYKILSELGNKRRWCDVNNFGEQDLSGAPGYGTYDMVNIGLVSAEALSEYDYLIFTGWNTMTEEIYEKLISYVKGGGKLFMCAAHLNTSEKRNGEINLIKDGDLTELFGAKLDGKNAHISNAGVKFFESQCEDIRYPYDKTSFDPLLSSGYAKYAKAELDGAKAVAILSTSFSEKNNVDGNVALLENKLGEGYAILLTSLDYPGAGQTYDIYRTVVRELLRASHKTADVKVIANDRVRFTVYESRDVYLLNTDFDVPSYARVEKDGKTVELTLAPCEIKHINI